MAPLATLRRVQRLRQSQTHRRASVVIGEHYHPLTTVTHKGWHMAGEVICLWTRPVENDLRFGHQLQYATPPCRWRHRFTSTGAPQVSRLGLELPAFNSTKERVSGLIWKRFLFFIVWNGRVFNGCDSPSPARGKSQHFPYSLTRHSLCLCIAFHGLTPHQTLMSLGPQGPP